MGGFWCGLLVSTRACALAGVLLLTAPALIGELGPPGPRSGTATEIASVTDSRSDLAAAATPDAGGGPGMSGGGGADSAVPSVVLAAYRRAADSLAGTTPGCRLPWYLLAGVGRVESEHAYGGRVDAAGTTRGQILGLRLDGGPGIAAIPDTDGGRLDGDTVWDRAVGPMHFIPSTWSAYGADGNADGSVSPHNVYDAALAAGRYLCAGGGDLSGRQDQIAALFRYNRSAEYGLLVLRFAAAYAGGVDILASEAGSVPAPAHQPAVQPDAAPAIVAQPGVPPSTTVAGPPVRSAAPTGAPTTTPTGAPTTTPTGAPTTTPTSVPTTTPTSSPTSTPTSVPPTTTATSSTPTTFPEPTSSPPTTQESTASASTSTDADCTTTPPPSEPPPSSSPPCP